MNDLPEPIKSILRDYCHVEWFEINELADDVRSGNREFDVVALKEQFESMISEENDITQLVNSLTFNEFVSMDEVRSWLREIYSVVFPK